MSTPNNVPRRDRSRGLFGSTQGTIVVAVVGMAMVGYGLFAILTGSGASPTPSGTPTVQTP